MNLDPELADGKEFEQIRSWLLTKSGIYLNETRDTLIRHRLHKRMAELQVACFSRYAQLLLADQAEQQVALNLLTTNETYFFREIKHFEFIREKLVEELHALPEVKVWSAASSSGEEAYSLAMLLADIMPEGKWQVLGTDINTDMLQLARKASYPLTAKNKIPAPYLKRYCLKGVGKGEGWFKIKNKLAEKVTFKHHNLLVEPINNKEKFDLIFLRNVLIYFRLEDRKKVVQNLINQMRPGAWLIVGHSESIYGFDPRLVQQQPGCYQYQL